MAAEESSRAESLGALLGRRSVSPKRLCHPGPDMAQLELMLQAALRAPDHGGLLPWRVIEFRAEQRDALAECFAQEKQRRDPLASGIDLRRAREHATRAPVLLGFVFAPQSRSRIPVREQWLAAGAALGNLLNAAHQLGFGAIMLSGERCHDSVLLEQIGIAGHESLAGFVTVGSIAEAPPRAPQRPTGKVWSCWNPLPREASAPRSAG